MPLIRGRCRFLVVNLAFRLVPEADLLYAADSGFWHIYGDARRFAGAKVSADRHSQLYCDHVRVATIPVTGPGERYEPLIHAPTGTLGNGGGNSGFQALNLAVQLGARRILLAGLDFSGRHWHEDHPSALRNPSAQRLARWGEHFDRAADTLRQWGVTVCNLSARSALRSYPYVDPKSIFADQGPPAL